jgi:hypothetical protein
MADIVGGIIKEISPCLNVPVRSAFERGAVVSLRHAGRPRRLPYCKHRHHHQTEPKEALFIHQNTPLYLTNKVAKKEHYLKRLMLCAYLSTAPPSHRHQEPPGEAAGCPQGPTRGAVHAHNHQSQQSQHPTKETR